MASQALAKQDEGSQAVSPLVLSLAVGKPKRSAHKLTPQKRKQFLQHLGREMNMSKAAKHVGVTVDAIYKLMQSDEHFAKAVELVKGAYLDSIEATSYEVAIIPSREGFQDRKLLLQAHRREIYGDKVQVDSQVKVNVEHSIPQLSAILAGNGLRELSGPQEIPYQEVREENQAIDKSGVTKKD